MILWLATNVVLPFIPLIIVRGFSALFRWQKGFVALLADGQLYFFSVALCGVFAFDALKAGKLNDSSFIVLFFAVIVLVAFHTAAIFVAHSAPADRNQTAPNALNAQRDSRRLALISVFATVTVIVAIVYERLSLGLIG